MPIPKPEAKENSTKKMAELKELFNNDYSEIKGLEIFNTFYNSHDIPFTEADLDEMVKNHYEFLDQKAPHIKISHSDQQTILKELFKLNNVELGEELPNLGFLENFRRVGNSILADAKNIPTALVDTLFNNKMFKAISPEISMNFKGTGKKLIEAIGLTNNPALKHIADVHMSETLRYGGEIQIIKGENKMDPKDQKTQFDADAILADESFLKKFAEKIGFKKKEEPVKIITAQPGDEDKVALSEVQKMNADWEAKFNDLKNKLIDKDKDSKKFSESLKKIEDNTRKEKAELICKEAKIDGVPPVVIDALKPLLFADFGEHKVKFSEKVDGEVIEAERTVSEAIQSFFRVYPDKIDFSDKTQTELNPPSDEKQKQIEDKVKVYMSEGMTKHAALQKAGAEVY